MKLDVKALGLTLAVAGGGSILVVGISNLIWPAYGEEFLGLTASVYPGYSASASFGQAVIGTLYALVDCFIAGLIVAWLYNAFLSTPTRPSAGAS